MNKHARYAQVQGVMNRWGKAAVFAALSVIAACSKESNTDAVQQQVTQTKRLAKVPEDPLAGMTGAITASKGDLPVDVRFQLASRPQPGQPVEVKVAFASKAELMGLHAVIKPNDSLKMANDVQTRFDALKPGEIKDYSFTATPPTSGIYIATLELTVTRDAGDNTYSYSIPLAVPNPAPPASSSSAAAKSGSG